MCRLFAMACPRRVRATFWLLEAPDSLVEQSHRNPDGTGLGFFDEAGQVKIAKEPIAAYVDSAFAREARDATSRTFVSHVRHASNGGSTEGNTHPFAMDGRIFAHNGIIGDVDRLDDHLGVDLSLVKGDTDSERYFALITAEIRRAQGDVLDGITTAVTWMNDNLGIYAANFVLASATELWAFRFPTSNTLFYLDRDPDTAEQSELEQQSKEGTRISSEPLADLHSVIVASEKLDDDPRWRPLTSGQLLHVGEDTSLRIERLIAGQPRHPLILDDVSETARNSQR